MPDPNPPDDGTRRSPPPPPTGAWPPGPVPIPARVGRFEVRAVLGEGAFGRVYLGFDPELEREVAIKVPKPDGFTPAFRDAFLRENRLAAIIHHANICPIYEVGTDGAVPYIVMRYVAGGTLAGLLTRLATPMPPRNAVAITRKLALGLAAAHAQRIIHRDLKPANVLYDEANREVLIADFGLARFVDQASASSAGVPKGTPAYMSPEQARGLAAVIGAHSDVYSLGVMLYEMVTGRVPFDGSIWEVMRDHCETPPRPPSSVRPGLDPGVNALCLKAMAKNPADRYRSAKDFVAALSDYLQGGAAGNEELMLAEEIGDAGGKPAGPARGGPAEVLELDDDPTGPASALRDTTASAGAKATDPARPPARPDADEPSEVILCPKCKARMQVRLGRTRPVDCPLCNVRFAVAAGRQALARSSDAKPRPQPVEKAQGARGGRRKPIDDDRIPPADWVPAARGLRLAWIGTLLSALVFAGIVAVAIVSIDQEPSPAKSSGSGYTKSGSGDSGSSPTGPRSGPLRSEYHTAYAVLGLGLAVGLIVVGVGRYQAGRLPDGVRGGGAAAQSAVADWLAAPCVATPFVLVSWLAGGSGPRDSNDGGAAVAAGVAAGAGFLLLLAGEFAFASYLTSLGRVIGRRFPRGLTTVSKVVLWVALSCAVIGGAAGGAAALLDDKKAASAVAFLAVLAGASVCLTFVLLPFWAIMTLILHVRAAVVVGWYARDEA